MTSTGGHYQWRPITETDLPAVGLLIRLVEMHDELGEVTTDERLAHEFAHDLDDAAATLQPPTTSRAKRSQ